MKTLIIYDETGRVFSQSTSTMEQPTPIGIPFLSVEIPEGKQIKNIDGIGVDVSVTPHQVILEDIPKTEVELLKEQLLATQQAVDFLLLGGI